MGWGTTFKAELYLDRLEFQSTMQLDEKISEVKEDIQLVKQNILMYASATPKDITPKDWEDDSISYINSKLNELFSELETQTELLINLLYYKKTNPKFKTKKLCNDAYCDNHCPNSENCDHVNCPDFFCGKT